MTGQQLKNSILQMAVQGKLVPQDPNDEPASVLLERIRKEKEQLIKEGKIKKEKNPSYIFRGTDSLPYEKVGKNEPVCIADEVPFDIPDSWEWARVSSLGSIVRGNGIKRTEIVESGKPCVRYGELYTTYHTSFTQAVSFVPEELFDRCKHFSFGDILMTLTGENKPDIAKAVAYLGNDEIAAGGDLAYWTAHGMNPLYLTYLMASTYVVGRKVNLATGDIIVHISGDKLGTILIPIPPLSEQQRIVDKILEAEVKLVEYTDKENSLDVLQKNFPDALKKSILQWAVQGKLVPQDPTDEPASVLLERIRAEKEQLIKAGKIKRDKHESAIFRRDNSHYEKRGSEVICIDDTIPFDIPDTWAWVRLRSVLEQASTGPFGSMIHKDDYTEKGIPIVNPANIADRRVIEYKIKRVSNETADRLKSYMLHSGDVIIGRRGEMGRSAVVLPQQEGWLCGTGCFYVTPLSGLSPEYLSFLLSSPYIRNALTDNSVGTTMNNLNHTILGELLIPLPPVNEQIQIMQQYKNVINIFGD